MKSIPIMMLIACGSQRPAAPGLSNSRVSTPPPEHSLALAEASLASDTPMDFDRPRVKRPRGRERTIELFHLTCADGNHRACWIEAQLVRGQPLEAFRRVAADCHDGDLLSCRALPLSETEDLYPDEPGAESRSPRCHSSLKSDCNSQALRGECLIGFTQACNELAGISGIPDQDELDRRGRELAADGCKQGIAPECLLAIGAAHTLEASKRFCDLTDNCSSLGHLYDHLHEPTLARDSLERTCQYAKDAFRICLALATRYLAHDYDEPVAGRA
jgi:hypothetical protein